MEVEGGGLGRGRIEGRTEKEEMEEMEVERDVEG